MSDNKHQSLSTTTSRSVNYEELMLGKITTGNTYRQIVVALADQYMTIKEHYNLNEDATIDKIIEIAQKLCSKI